jgi:hypothetical protein
MRRMKYLRSLMLAVIMLIPATSCNEWLELIPPDGLVLDEYWKTKEDLEATLMGAYQRFARQDEILFLYGELRGGMIDEASNTPGNHQNIMEGNIFPDNDFCNWSELYRVINYCNNVMKYAPEILDIDRTFTEFNMKAYQAEAVFLRSLAYFYLVRVFKDVPLMLEPSEADDVDFFINKSADTTILRVIKKDLETYRFFVRDEYGSQEENKGRATKGAFLALLADICLWNFEYEDCIKYVNEMEDELDYLLLPAGAWFELFYPGNSLESIFEFQFDESLDQRNTLYTYTYFDYYEASISAVELLTPLPPAREIIRGYGSLRFIDGLIWKYCGAAPDGGTFRPSSENESCNYIVYRYADVLLMKAEALSQTDRFQEAQTIVNTIRYRANMNPVSIPFSPQAMEDAIMEERARELAFEGKRWFDLMRLGRRNNYDRKEKLIETIVERVPSTQRLVLASKLTNPLGWYLPIYDLELERNKNLVQNPYYADYSRD